MANSCTAGETIHIRGTPPSLFSVLKLDDFEPGPLTIDLQLPLVTRKASLPSAKISLIKGTDLARCKLRLDRMTPPGTYKGTVEIQKQNLPLVVEVESSKQIQLFPKYANLEAHPEERKRFCLTIINTGNVPFEIPRKDAFGLYDQMGVDMAVGKVFKKRNDKSKNSVDYLMKKLQDGYGGIVVLELKSCAGKLEPGESRELSIEIHMPDDVIPGRSYWGLWKICDYNFKFEFDITADSDRTGKHKRH